jgi:hypothetical protein
MSQGIEAWEWRSEARTRERRLVEVCGHCGIPCSGTVLFWHENGDHQVLVEVDGPTISALFQAVWPVADYDAMPRIWRDANECTGWEAVEATHGVAYEAADLALLVKVLREKPPDGEWPPAEHVRAVLEALDVLSQSALAAGAAVLVKDD